MYALFIDLHDARLAESAVGADVHLVTGVGKRRAPYFIQRHGKQRDRLLFTGGEQDVEFARRRIAMHALGELDERVGHAAHGRHHDHDVVPLSAETFDALGDRLDALGVADGSTAVFLYDQGHAIRLRETTKGAN